MRWKRSTTATAAASGCRPAGASPSRQLDDADALHAALMQRADALAGFQEGSGEEAELKSIFDAIEAYEARRWPLGRDPTMP